eukprot:scaffold167507_cov30-Tisochrysis_lutea.AAC.2
MWESKGAGAGARTSCSSLRASSSAKGTQRAKKSERRTRFRLTEPEGSRLSGGRLGSFATRIAEMMTIARGMADGRRSERGSTLTSPMSPATVEIRKIDVAPMGRQIGCASSNAEYRGEEAHKAQLKCKVLRWAMRVAPLEDGASDRGVLHLDALSEEKHVSSPVVCKSRRMELVCEWLSLARVVGECGACLA